LIATERDKNALLRGICRILVESGNYDAAVIAENIFSADSAVIHSCGNEKAIEELKKKLAERRVPLCWEQASKSANALVCSHSAAFCDNCPRPSHISALSHLTCRIQRNGIFYGILDASLSGGVDATNQELVLIEEAARTIAYAIHVISQQNERSYLHEQLKDEEQFMDAAVNALQDVFLVFAPLSGKALGWNRALREISGFTNEEINSIEIPDGWHDAEDSAKFKKALDEMGSYGMKTLEVSLRAKNGTEIPLEYTLSKVSRDAGGRECVVAVGRNVSYRRMAMEALVRSERKFRAFFDNNPDYCCILSTAGVVIDVNAAMLDALGYDRDDIVGWPLSRIYAPEAMAEDNGIFNEWLYGGSIRNKELKILNIAGERRIVLLSIDAVYDESGLMLHAVCVMRDLTEQKKMEISLAQADRLASMGLLAASVTHDVNNPLTYLLSNLSSLQEDFPRFVQKSNRCRSLLTERLGKDELEALLGDEAEIFAPGVFEELLERINDAMAGAWRIKEISSNLNAFSRIEREKLAPVDIEQPIEAAATMIFSEIKRRARLVKNYEPTPPVMAGEGKLFQVFSNLLMNACQAIEKGNVEGNEIRIRTWREGNQVCAEIADTGIGISRENLERLFNAFFTTKESAGGSGLGLAISRNIISAYGGEIEARSEAGKGSSFVVRLPGICPTEKMPPEIRFLENKDEPLTKDRILVVDDDEATRKAVEKTLCDEHEVVVAKSGEEGIELLENDKNFDLVVCNMLMSGMSGIAFHQRLAETSPELAGKLVFIAGAAFTPRAREYLKKTHVRLIESPFNRADFKKKVKNCMTAAKISETSM